MGRELTTIVRDLPVEIDLEAARLGDYDRDTVVRLFREYEFRTLIERLPTDGRRVRGGADGALRSVAQSGYVPLRGSPAAVRGLGPGTCRGTGPSSGELQLRLDFDAVAAPAPSSDGATDGRRSPSGSSRRRTCRPPSPRRSSTPGASRSSAWRSWATSSSWLVGAARDRSSAPRADDPRPRRGRPLALAVAGSEGRVVAADGPEAADACAISSSGVGIPLVGHEVKPVLVATFADDAAEPLPVAFDTQIAAYILNAALRSQTIADVVAENLDQILPPTAELPATARAGLEALSAIAGP